MKPKSIKTELVRCGWASHDPIYQRYHDREWGVPLHNDRRLFEMLCLEGAQAGLSWITILKKRDNYRRAFYRFDPKKVARMTPAAQKRLLGDAGIIRNRLKIKAFILNAQAYFRVREEFGTFDRYIWSFVGGKPIRNRRRTLKQVPATSPESDRMSKDLKKRGFKFVGSTICYAYMQAVGLVDDHIDGCWRRRY